MLYNAELKERYLNNFNEGISRVYKHILSKAYILENQLNKDIYEFSIDEANSLIGIYSNRSYQAVQTVFSCLRQYIDYCIKQGYVFDRINYFKTIGGLDQLEKYTDLNVAEKKYITFDELLEIEDSCNNAQDAIIPELLFIGLKGNEAEELLNLKIADCEERRIYVPNRGKNVYIKISDRTYGLIQEAINQKRYEKGNGDTSERTKVKDIIINPTEYVLRTAGSNKYGRMNYQSLIMRIGRIKEYFGNPYLSINNLWVSGMIQIAKQIKEQKGELQKEDYEKINKEFGYDTKYFYQTKIRIKNYV